MIIKQLSRYPIKGLNGELLVSAQLEVGGGIVGDRRFAFGVDETVNDGAWRSSRSYLINAVNDNLLKFNLTADERELRIQNPQGEVLHLEPDGSDNLDSINASLQTFMSAVTSNTIPRLIDRKKGCGPKGHWDFPDTELLIVNLETVRELEKRWDIEIDPRRFRYNILIDDIPAWSEFGLYGCRLSAGDVHIDVLRPARRCAATAVNPDTGDRDEDILRRLVQDYGHGFLGVYAKVSQAGEIAVGQRLQQSSTNVVSPEQAGCEPVPGLAPGIAPGFAHWPKAAILRKDGINTYTLEAATSWPLIIEAASGNIKIHHGKGLPIVVEIQSCSDNNLLVALNGSESDAAWMDDHSNLQKPIFISGPFVPRRKH